MCIGLSNCYTLLSWRLCGKVWVAIIAFLHAPLSQDSTQSSSMQNHADSPSHLDLFVTGWRQVFHIDPHMHCSKLPQKNSLCTFWWLLEYLLFSDTTKYLQQGSKVFLNNNDNNKNNNNKWELAFSSWQMTNKSAVARKWR